ncbi:MAG: hypothetical protein ACK504_06650 [Bacteroidota bacterium]
MTFWQRLRFFLIGFIPGCIILFLIVNRKGCTSPNELKMKELGFQKIEFSSKAQCKLKCLKQSEETFKLNLNKFEVNYNLSDVHQKPFGIYYLQSIDKKNGLYDIIIADKDSISFVQDIKISRSTIQCACDTIN